MLLLGPEDMASLRAHAEQEYPRECCGILLGGRSREQRRVTRVVRCRNMRPESDRYSIDPVELIAAQKAARNAGLEILGFYHSHPEHRPEPSAVDLEEAHWVGCSYVIVEVREGKAAATRAFLLTASRGQKSFASEELRGQE